jgi:mRNA-degrading endonuclease YafQ of YafQ-DinJ toxin-antitoxin module
MYKKLPVQVQRSAESKEDLFRENPFHPSLRTHKLTGKLKDYWAFSIGYNYRIIFSFESEKHVLWHAVGSHAIYQNFKA